MNIKSLQSIAIIITLVTIPISAKRPPREKQPKEPRPALTHEQKQIIAANIAQVMGGICSIAQDPRNPYNIGNSVAGMIQALINIIIERFAKKDTTTDTPQTIEESLTRLGDDLSKEITEIIVKKKLILQDNS